MDTMTIAIGSIFTVSVFLLVASLHATRHLKFRIFGKRIAFGFGHHHGLFMLANITGILMLAFAAMLFLGALAGS